MRSEQQLECCCLVGYRLSAGRRPSPLQRRAPPSALAPPVTGPAPAFRLWRPDLSRGKGNGRPQAGRVEEHDHPRRAGDLRGVKKCKMNDADPWAELERVLRES